MISQFPAQQLQPATFIERGIFLPLTTPLLQGARVRNNAQQRLELVVPNPAGSRGVYVLPWAGWAELCQPTLHDLQLQAVVLGSPGLSPQGIRAAARLVAEGGAAGRAARASALQAAKKDAESRQSAQRHFSFMLAAEPNLVGDYRDVSAVADAVEALGFGEGAEKAALHRRLARLRQFRDGLGAWVDDHADEIGRIAQAVHALADAAIRSACVLIERTRARSISEILLAWRRDPADVTEAAARPAWVLDGWDLPCSLWQTAENEGHHRSALADIAMVAPILPSEAASWVPGVALFDECGILRRCTTQGQSASTGLAGPDLVARNEQLLAMAA